MCPRLMLAGGGGANDSKLLDEQFAKWTSSDGKLLYLPIAMDEQRRSYASCLNWLTSVFRPLGINNIEMWTDLRQHERTQLDQFDSIYIGGGNTFRLLHLLCAAGFDQALLRFIQRGGAVYGGSAGAIVLGRDILTCEHMNSNNVGLTDMRGLDVVKGYAIWCHYRPENDVRIAAYVERHNFPVLGLSERTGLCIEGNRFVVMGFEPAIEFVTNRRRNVRTWESLLPQEGR